MENQCTQTSTIVMIFCIHGSNFYYIWVGFI